MFAAAILLGVTGVFATAFARWLHVRIVFCAPQCDDARE